MYESLIQQAHSPFIFFNIFVYILFYIYVSKISKFIEGENQCL